MGSPTEEKPNLRRIRNELHQFWVDPPVFCRAGPSPVTDLLHWEVDRMGAAPSSPTEEKPNLRRIRNELHQFWVDPPVFCRAGPSPVTDLLHWEVVIDGPEDSPYAGGTFALDVQFSCSHPLKPVKITFKTKVYHPNIDSEGRIFVDILDENWSPAMTINHLLLSVVSVLHDPLLDYPVNLGMARLYQRNTKLYEKKARAWTRKHASAPVASYIPEKGDVQWQEYCDAFAKHYKEIRRRRAAEPSAGCTVPPPARGASLLWRRAVAFLQRWSVAAPPAAKVVAE